MESKFKAAVAQFQSAITSATERFQKHLKDLREIAGAQMHEIPGSSFNVDLRVKNGVSIVGLVATVIGGAAMLFSNPAGWVVITLGVASIVLSLVKALWSSVDDDFRKAQQRKAVDKNLTKALRPL